MNKLWLLIGIAVMSWICCGCDPQGEDAPSSSLPSTEHTEATQDLSFTVRFVDVTRDSGIDFVHTNGMAGEKLLPETLGSGVAILDYDGDGNLDIFFVNSRRWSDSGEETSRLYRGDGAGHFRDVTVATGAGVRCFGMGCCAADADADGDLDLFITAMDGNTYLRNDAGHFVDATAQVGLQSRVWIDADGKAIPEWSTCAAWFDVEGDGDLDLFVGHYCRWTPQLEIFTTLDGSQKAFTTPDAYEGLPCRLFLNDGSGHFAEGPAREELDRHPGKSLGVALWDFDDDGRLDVVVANDTRPNFFFRNKGGGVLEEQGLYSGIAYDREGRARAGMGIDIADLNANGHTVVAVGNFAEEPVSLYEWTPQSGLFDEIAASRGLVQGTYSTLAFGLGFFDADLDGWLDLLVVNGHIEPQIEQFSAQHSAQSYAQPCHLFRGVRSGFVEVTKEAGGALQTPRVARGLAWGDLDRDGDIDVVITTNGGAPVLLRNDLAEEAGSSAVASRPTSLRVDLVNVGTLAPALGARATLVQGGHTQVRWVRTGSSYLSQSEPTLTFGIDGESSATLHIRWANGRISDHEVAAGQRDLLLPAPR